jgi:hypothetical protein
MSHAGQCQVLDAIAEHFYCPILFPSPSSINVRNIWTYNLFLTSLEWNDTNMSLDYT